MTEQFRFGLSEYLVRDTSLTLALQKSPFFSTKGKYTRINYLWHHSTMSYHRPTEIYEFVVSLFSRHQDLTSNEEETLGPILAEVCSAALIGMMRVFHFYEHGAIITEPALFERFSTFTPSVIAIIICYIPLQFVAMSYQEIIFVSNEFYSDIARIAHKCKD
ncbi:hypothetical protein M426DRAFT_19979 [Hypoxylon sp. CI-4A]|nr:hypothetical protein M426DRAFT_19979 [Hypoxylon sp. CI-4A]